MPILSEFGVNACVLSLASNLDEKQTLLLQFAQQKLQSLGKVNFSQIIINPVVADQPTYHNQMAYIQFEQPINYQQLLKKTKEIEQQGGRAEFAKPLVTLDVDIIAVKTQRLNQQILIDEKGKPFIALSHDEIEDEQWFGISRRFPLANYETAGLLQLIQQN